MTKILFMINTLASGGAEQALVNLVNKMDKGKYDITVMTLFNDGINSERLDSSVRYINKNAPHPRGIAYFFKIFSEKRLYKYFVGDEHYDIIVSFLQGAATKIAAGCPDKDTKLVTWIHNGNPKARCYFAYWFTKKKALAAYKKMDVVVAVSKVLADRFLEHTGIRVETLYNTNNFDRIEKLASEEPAVKLDKNKITLCSVGTLKPEKGFDRLINVTARLKAEGVNVETIIAGAGVEKESLQEQIDNLKANDSAKLVGFLENPYSVMKAADIYVLSSRNEGLPLVVTEALYLGRPIVATDVGGVRELLGDSEYGLVVQNSEEGIYEGIKKMTSDDELMNSFAKTDASRVIDFYPEKTVAAVEGLFDRLYEHAN